MDLQLPPKARPRGFPGAIGCCGSKAKGTSTEVPHPQTAPVLVCRLGCQGVCACVCVCVSVLCVCLSCRAASPCALSTMLSTDLMKIASYYLLSISLQGEHVASHSWVTGTPPCLAQSCRVSLLLLPSPHGFVFEVSSASSTGATAHPVTSTTVCEVITGACTEYLACRLHVPIHPPYQCTSTTPYSVPVFR